MDSGVNDVGLSTLSLGQRMDGLSFSKNKIAKIHQMEERILANEVKI